ncbi:MAG: hypothetical protein IJD49_01760 [Clostridia bacterium]|nr:hypothetical protein [Clostridia bacterium]
MKKLVSIILAAGVLASTAACSAKETAPETTTVPETTAAVQEQTAAEVTAPETEYETVVIENSKYKFTLQKSDFEKNYSEETLMKISSIIPLEYGCDDYDNWDGTPEEVINDAICGSFDSRSSFNIEMYSFDGPERKAAEAEIEGYNYKIWNEYEVTDIECINECLVKSFGPDARQFKPEDFDTYEQAVTQDGNVTEDIPTFCYRYIYLPETEFVICCIPEITGRAGDITVLYVYDIQTVGGDYVVKAVYGISGYPDYELNTDSFAGLQSDALKMFGAGTDDLPYDCTMVIGEAENGDLYMKSVTKGQITSEK